ncbi:MAG: class B sortase [Coriobacteriales bacterium]|jgi:sortase B|nr:class B sortase [Coriobacteriales bacterium]
MATVNGRYKAGHTKPDKAALRSRAFLILGIALIAAALVLAGLVVYKYLNARLHNSELAITADGLEITAGSSVPADISLDTLDINWAALQAINPDIIAWVLIPGTNVNYPVVQGTDNEYYLTHLADGTYSPAGAIFSDYENSRALDGRSNFIYGHNMLDGTMFSDLTNFNDRAYFDEHRRIILCTPTRQLELESIAILECSAYAEVRQLQFVDDTDFTAYLTDLLGYAVNMDETAAEGVYRVYCFSTCTDYGNVNRSILIARISETREVI